MQNKTAFLLSTVGVLALLLIGVFIFHSHATPGESAPSVASTTTTTVGNVAITAPQSVTIKEVSTDPVPGVPRPDLNHVVVFSSDVSPDVVSTIKSQITTLVGQLQKGPSNGQAWLQLAIEYKTAGDFAAAENVWIYMTKVAPTSPVAFQDLGDLYQNFLKNNSKAEANYLQVLKLDPKNSNVYSDLYMLYRYQENNPTAAKNILAQGLKANPNDPSLLALQSQAQSGQ